MPVHNTAPPLESVGTGALDCPKTFLTSMGKNVSQIRPLISAAPSLTLAPFPHRTPQPPSLRARALAPVAIRPPIHRTFINRVCGTHKCVPYTSYLNRRRARIHPRRLPPLPTAPPNRQNITFPQPCGKPTQFSTSFPQKRPFPPKSGKKTGRLFRNPVL